MPYLFQERLDALKRGERSKLNAGDWNALFTLIIIDIWNNDPRYTTIHDLKKAFNDPKHPFISELHEELINLGISSSDINAAKELAFMEFYRRVGGAYENFKSVQNGDIYKETVKNLYETIYGGTK